MDEDYRCMANAPILALDVRRGSGGTGAQRESEQRMAYADNYSATLARNYVETTGLTRRAPADLRLPCMVYAAVGALAEAGGGAAEAAMGDARRAPGVLNVLPYPGGLYEGSLGCLGGVAVVTRGYWLARQALGRLMEQCGVDAPQAEDGAAAAPDGAGAPASTLTGSSAACTVQFYQGRLRLWLPTSQPERVRAAAARLAGVAPETVDLRVLGGQDAPQGLAVLVPGIALARALESAPVQLIIAYDLGLLCDVPTHAEAPRLLREVPALPAEVALAA